MGGIALAVATASIVSLLLPRFGMYIALGAAILAIGVGWVAYHRRDTPGSARLAAAGAMAVGGTALLLAIAKISLTLAAIDAADGLLN